VIDYAHFAPGQTFARRYAIVHLIKAGGMGAVYEATHVQTRRRVALKVMRPEIVADPGERARFIQEAQVATLIESAHVVDVLDAGVDDDTGVPFLVMEFLAGEELGDYVKRRGPLPGGEVVAILQQAARALDKAHARGVVHRDLKPENIFVSVRDEQTTVKILDFGIAKVLQSANSSSTRGTGTPLYMAPEQTRRSSKIGPTTDIWALGLIAYRLLVGHPYWLADDVHQLIGEVLIEDLEPPTARARRFGVALPPTFDGWFFGCVNRDPSSRYPTAGEAIHGLAAVFGVEMRGSPVPSMPHGYSMPPPNVARTVPATQAFGAGATAIALAETTASPQTRDDEARGIPRRGPLYAGIGMAVIALGVGLGLYLRSTDDAPKANAAPSSSPEPKTTKSAKTPDKSSLAATVEKTNPFVTVKSLPNLRVQRHEVTRDEYAHFITSLPEDERDEARPRDGWRGEPVEPATKDHPVTWVTFERAVHFCSSIDGRLPTSDEFTKALEGKYLGAAWPKDPSALAIGLGENALPRDVEKTPSDQTPSGLFDLAGNVQEWTTTKAETSGMVVVRGGSVSMLPDDAKEAVALGMPKYTEASAPKDSQATALAGARLGLRCVRDAR
jgi:serine/threonine protein kinase